MTVASDSFSLESYQEIVKRIDLACQKSQRDVQDVCLIGVTKKKPASSIIEAHQTGLCDFGENYVQEFAAKQEQLFDLGLHWHFIGHLQKNKVKNVIGKVHLLHSLDSHDLAIAIDKEAQKKGIIQNCLLQIHLGDEESKFGIQEEDAISLLQELSSLKSLSVKGLMGLPPFFENPEDVRPYFKKLHGLKNQINDAKIYPQEILFLSMGMSHDFEIAIEEGATHIRVGTALFGERQITTV